MGTVAVLSEFHGRFLYVRGPEPAQRRLSALLDDPGYEWRDVSVDLVRSAQEAWLGRFSDQAFSLVDALSFELMRREGLDRAFAFDHHFEIAGFELLR